MGRLRIRVNLDTERVVLKEIIEKIRGKIFIDIGAFIGEYSVNLSDNFEEIWAFEPAGDSCGKLKRNITKYKIKNIKIFNQAVGSEIGCKKLFRNKQHHLESTVPSIRAGGLTGFKERNLRGETVPLTKVRVTTLKEIIQKREIDLVKIDTEGYEEEILKGGQGVMNQISNFMIEMHGNHGEVCRFMNQNGFKLNKKWNKRFWFVRVKK